MNDRSLLLRFSFAPALLVVVALVQVVLVETRGLSPWKGGGFGMFAVSTNRMTTIEAETTRGEPVKIAFRPGGFEHLGWMSDTDDYRRMADEMLTLEYVDALDQNDAFLSKVAIDDPGAAAKLAELFAANAKRRADADRTVWLRPPGDEGPPDGVDVHRLAKITVHRWRVQFDPATDRLRLVADGDAIVAVIESEPSSDLSLAPTHLESFDVGD